MCQQSESGSKHDGDGRDRMSRRGFLAASAIGTVGVVAGLPKRMVMAGPFEASDYTSLIPADKKLDTKWVQSLFDPGEPEVYRDSELSYIGMPVGGICTGQVYLGGDGRLWLWDVFNKVTAGVCAKGTNGENYVKPLEQTSPLDQGFAVHIPSDKARPIRTLDRNGFSEVTFEGKYPIGRVRYRDTDCPVQVDLEAFSPFVPLQVEDSSYPAVVMQYRITNTSSKSVSMEITGWLENAVCLYTGGDDVVRRNRIVRSKGMTMLECSAMESPEEARPTIRDDIRFEDFEKGTYEGWTVEGTAFGDEPMKVEQMPAYQGTVGAQGKRLVNTHNTRNGEDVTKGDAHTGRLTSRVFKIERDYINFLIGGGSHAGKTCMNLLVDGQVVRTAVGRNDNRMFGSHWDVRELQGRQGRIEIVDQYTTGWGNIGIDEIVFSDTPRSAANAMELKRRHDFGSMVLGLLDAGSEDRGCSLIPGDEALGGVFRDSSIGSVKSGQEAVLPFGRKARGSVTRMLKIGAGKTETVTFGISWCFPNLTLQGFGEPVGRYYSNRFGSAREVAEHLAENFIRLAGQTRRWVDTWYDSTLPQWFLNRTFANTSTLATSTCYRFADGRFYAWEGIGCCAGTCTHVWHYAQAVARVFPELERDLRRRVDYGVGFDERTGGIGHRAEFGRSPADDGQAGVILRTLREHQMSCDDAFLKDLWPRVKKAVQYLIDKDGNADGIIEGPQPNTLDAAWYGKIAWLTSLYLAALRAGQEMALEMGETEFAQKAGEVYERGAQNIVKLLFNGEYFIQIPDPEHMDAIGADTGCYIDQVFGQSWAFQVGLGRLYSREHIRKALQSLWTYNFAPDVGPFKEVYKKGRPYALAGDAGMIMCTWPRGGKRKDWEKHWQFGYFNECMSGFEWQVAGHMIAEGMSKEGLAVARAIHDRYHPSLRNPYNEIECSDHYARAMASFGAFLTACGYEHHGPKGVLGFAPKLSPEDFRAGFTTAQGWGSFSQKREDDSQREEIEVRYGTLTLKELNFELVEGKRAGQIDVTVGGDSVAVTWAQTESTVKITFGKPVAVGERSRVVVDIQL